MSDGRLEQFKSDIADMRIKDPVASRDALLVRAGAALMVLGVVITIVSYFLSHSTFSVANHADDTMIALIGVAVTVLGAAVFLRYSLASFLRFWLARLIYEQQAQTDRLLAARPDREASRQHLAPERRRPVETGKDQVAIVFPGDQHIDASAHCQPSA